MNFAKIATKVTKILSVKMKEMIYIPMATVTLGWMMVFGMGERQEIQWGIGKKKKKFKI